MVSSVESFIPILFKILFGFVGLNIVINFILLYIKRMKMYMLLATFWPAVLLVFISQGSFQEGILPVTYAYSVSLLTMSLISMIGFQAMGHEFPWKKYIIYFIPFFPLTYFLYYLGFGFTTVAMPFAIATATPLIHAALKIHIFEHSRTTKLQKVLGFVYILMAIHCINFALFRMDKGAQLWGWLTAYAIYDMLAILLPSIALEEANLSENDRLQQLVNVKTGELNESLKANDSLFKILVHDISNPLSVMKGYLAILKKTDEDKELFVEKIEKSQYAMENIIQQVKSLYLLKNSRNKIALEPVKIDDCFKEISFIFSHVSKNKGVNLKINNSLGPDVKVLAEQISLTHSVLANLVSNGIKFTPPNSGIEISAKEMAERIVLEVRDEGPGISEDIINDLMANKDLNSSQGTFGEKGSGFGLSIVKSFVDFYGGEIEFDSHLMKRTPDLSEGTSVRIILPRA